MYFKKLQLFGFKSFADKTVLNFEPGVTAIVGPNGVGKSNLSDSIRWVLGEQSARAMRSSKMEDVIFNGTDNKDPLGMAEVSLAFHNSPRKLLIDHDEVTISRKVFRSGESEYYINDRRVRLKDIQDLFAGTGIGSSSYSHIEQGKIDQVLSSKPEERRSIFEEASGITKYKARKKEALLKLEHTENNLLRISDIINEVKRQIGSIERQAAKAKRYREKFDALKDLEIKAAVYEKARLRTGRDSSSQSLQSLREKIQNDSERLSHLKAEERALRAKLSEADNQIAQLQTKSVETRNTIARDADKISLNRERIAELKSRREKLAAEIEHLKGTQSALEEKMNSAKMDFEALLKDKKENAGLLEEKGGLLAELSDGIGKSHNVIKEAKTRSVDVASGQSRKRNDIAKLQADISNSSARARRLRLDREDVLKEVEGLTARLEGLKKKVREQEEAAEMAQGRKELIETDIAQTLDSMEKLKESIDGLNHSFTSMDSKLEFLEEMKRRYQGFEEAAKGLLTSEDEGVRRRYGLVGALSDLIQVKEEFALAIDIALGAYAQCLVVERTDNAKAALTDLKSRGSGRAGFLSMDMDDTERTDFPSGLRDTDGIIGRASDLIQCEGGFKRALDVLLDEVYIVRDLDVIWNLPRDSKRRGCYITKEGDVCYKGALIGGKSTADEGRSPILRDARIRQLKGEMETVKKRLEAQKAELSDKDRGLKDLRMRLNEANVKLEEEKIKLANLKSEFSSLETECGKAREELSVLDLELDELAANEKELGRRHEELKKALEALEEEASELENTIRLNEELIESKSAQKEGALIEITELKAKLDNIKVLEEDRAKSLEMLNGTFSQNLRAIEARQSDLDSSSSKADELEKEIIGLESEIATLEDDAASIESELASFRDSRHSISAELEAAVDELSGLQDGVSTLDRKISELNAGISEVSLKENSLTERILELYRVDINTLEVKIEDDFDPEAVKGEIAQLKAKVESMGTVNLVAIEEHDELKERFQFLTKQNEDLLAAKDSLKKAIEKINRTTRKMFMETFEKVRQAFREYFRMLFGGGDADLVLMDEHNILECGIEIVAKPPGKKLQNISLMSGGERALCAIALLFAIFKVRPGPFCVLDEIDAPLDESNIGRFNDVLNDFLKMSQFIIITHNKKTITNADIMYGVTMQESGVSKIVSVKLSDSRKDKPRAEEKQEKQKVLDKV